VERDRHVKESDARRHREIKLLDLERRQVHVVDQVIEAPKVRERRLFDDAAVYELRERSHRYECPNRVTVARGALRTERATRRDQHRRTELERTAQEASAAPTCRLVDHELVGPATDTRAGRRGRDRPD
jgi:hypothetical protein